MADCVLCGRRDAGVAYACVGCARPVQIALERLARLAPELDVTIARQGRTGDGGRGGDDEPLPVNLAAAADAAAVVDTVVVWVQEVARRRGVRALGFRRLTGPACRTNAGGPTCRHRTCRAIIGAGQPVDHLVEAIRWMSGQVEWIRHQHDAAQVLDELDYAAQLAERIVDRKAPRWYAGPCMALVLVDEHGTATVADDGRPCGTDLYAYPGAAMVRCPRCRSEYDAVQRREWLLKAARDTLVHAELLARAVTALGVRGVDERPVTPAMVRGMAWRGRLEVRGHDQAGRALYRVGDILDRVDEQRIAAARRAGTKPMRHKVGGSAA